VKPYSQNLEKLMIFDSCLLGGPDGDGIGKDGKPLKLNDDLCSKAWTTSHGEAMAAQIREQAKE
jgi:hypothetical protein